MLRDFDDALATVTGGAELGRILVRRGGSLHIAGRYAQAQADLRQAITLTRQAGDTLWQARGLTAAALAHLATGAVDRAEAGLAAAELLFAATGQRLEIAYARHNRALVAFASGDLPGALRHLDDAARCYADLGIRVPDAALDRCAVLLARPARGRAGRRRGGPERPRHPTKQAKLLLAAVRIALAAGHCHQAAERAAMARPMFTAQHREWWRAHACFVLLQARFLAERRPPARLRLDDGPMTVALHRRLRAGSDPAGPGPGALAAALRDARADLGRGSADDQAVTAAGGSFIALGG